MVACTSEESFGEYSLELSYAELSAFTSNFDASCKLGSGCYGSVYRGVKNGTELAVKVLESPDEAGFDQELRILSKFRHPNLVTLIGFAQWGATRFLVYEMLAGDVHDRIQKSKSWQQVFSWRQRCSAALDAACGLAHLHSATPRVFHRDIKTPNILLDRNGTAKMADFGLACTSYAAWQRVDKVAGTPGYACPHYTRRGIVTEGTEVYAFGMVLLELLTATVPAVQLICPDGSPQYRFLICEIGGSPNTAVALADKTAQWPIEIAAAIAKIGLHCAEQQEDIRPSFVSLVAQLHPLRDFMCLNEQNQASRRHAAPSAQVASYAPAALQQYRVHRLVPQIRASGTTETPVSPHAAHLMNPWYLSVRCAHQEAVAEKVQSEPAADVRKQITLWSLTSMQADETVSKDGEAQDIVHSQEEGAAFATTLRVGRLFQEHFFNKAVANPCDVSREHFQIWATLETELPGAVEVALPSSIPCDFFLTNFSPHGTLVNGALVKGSKGQVQIHDGDMISLPTVSTGDGPAKPQQPFRFRFDLSCSILKDASPSKEHQAGAFGGA